MKFSVPIFTLKRRARAMARQDAIPLHQALDIIARQEGFARWSLLAARYQATRSDTGLARALEPGDLVLVAARPGHGKTLLALDALAAHVKSGGSGAIFSLEETAAGLARYLARLGYDADALAPGLQCCVEDDIDAARIIAWMRAAPRGSVVVIDYLQLLDQRRATPPLNQQVTALKAAAADCGSIVLCISQVNRAFELAPHKMPDLPDVRLPNPLDLSLFSKHVFLSDAEVEIRAA